MARADSDPAMEPHSGQNTTPSRACMTNSPQTRHSSEAPRMSAASSCSSVRANGCTCRRSQLTEDPHHPSQDLDVVGVDRLERRVLRLQADAAVLAIEGLDGRLVGGLVSARRARRRSRRSAPPASSARSRGRRRGCRPRSSSRRGRGAGSRPWSSSGTSGTPRCSGRRGAARRRRSRRRAGA